jgi:hypothetical protein
VVLLDLQVNKVLHLPFLVRKVHKEIQGHKDLQVPLQLLQVLKVLKVLKELLDL